MKLVTFEVDTRLGPFERIGALVDEHAVIIDLVAAYGAYLRDIEQAPAAAAIASATVGSTMIYFFRGGGTSRRAAEQAIAFAHAAGAVEEIRGARGEDLKYQFDEVRLKAPVPRPNTLRDYTGFLRHMETFVKKTSLPDATGGLLRQRPLYYKANPEMVLGPDELIPWPSFSEKLDIEVEPAIYIGLPGINIAVDRAHEHIGGYTIFNDISLRDTQMEELELALNPWGLSKSKDAGGYPTGPCVVTPDEIDSTQLELVVRVNGEEWIRGNTRDMSWSFEEMIAYSSLEEPLCSGDCLAGGSPPNGTGSEIGRWVQPGDIVECEISGIGVLRNTIGERAPNAVQGSGKEGGGRSSVEASRAEKV